MKKVKSIISLTFVFIFFLLECKTGALNVAEKNQEDIFSKWISTQIIRTDLNIYDAMKDVSNSKIQYIARMMPANLKAQMSEILPEISNEKLDNASIDSARKKILNIYKDIEFNMPAFIHTMKNRSFASLKVNKQEAGEDSSDVLAKYRKMMEILFFTDDLDKFDMVMGAMGNRFFEFCYYDKTFSQYKALTENNEQLSVVKLLNEISWYYLARREWKSWHSNTLMNLKKESESGKQVVYIAGGSDIYQLIKSGVYNIVNIDPIYPTQTKYYSEGWEYLARGHGKGGGIGDRITLEVPQKIIMTRASYVESGYVIKEKEMFGKTISIPDSITVWNIEDGKGKKLGTYKLIRRFVKQDDFIKTPDKVFLISFNELYFIMRTGPESWGIDPNKFSSDFGFYVKQLRNPVSYPVLMNIRRIQESPNSHVFGSSVIGK